MLSTNSCNTYYWLRNLCFSSLGYYVTVSRNVCSNFISGNRRFQSSLFYNTSSRYERHECDTNDTSETRVTRVRHKCYTNDTSATRMKNFDFHNETSQNIFSHPILAIWQMKDYEERNNIILRTTFWSCLVPMKKYV